MPQEVIGMTPRFLEELIASSNCGAATQSLSNAYTTASSSLQYIVREKSEVIAILSHPVFGRPTGAVARATRSDSGSPRGQSHPGLRTPRLVDLRESLQAVGISGSTARTICNSKRKSMGDLYGAKWRNFSHWCHERDADHL